MNNVLLIKNKYLRSWCIERFWGKRRRKNRKIKKFLHEKKREKMNKIYVLKLVLEKQKQKT